MGATYVFIGTLLGISLIVGLKIWELKAGSKLFSVIRYRLDDYAHRKVVLLKHYLAYVNIRTFRLLLVFFTAKIHALSIRLLDEWRNSGWWLAVRGKVLPKGPVSTVSAFLRDVAEYKNEIIKEELRKDSEQVSDVQNSVPSETENKK